MNDSSLQRRHLALMAGAGTASAQSSHKKGVHNSQGQYTQRNVGCVRRRRCRMRTSNTGRTRNIRSRLRAAATAPRLTQKPRSIRPGRFVCLVAARNQAALRFASISLRFTRHSAICTALSAAPLRRLSDTTHSTRPFSTVASSRMRLM